MEIVNLRMENINETLRKHQQEKDVFNQQKKYTSSFLDDKTKFIEIKETDEEVKKPTRRAKLTEEEIREERKRLQERAMKMSQPPPTTKRVHFQDDKMDVDSDDDDDDDEIPHKQFNQILIHHTQTDSPPIDDSSSSTLFSHPGAIGKSAVPKPEPVAFTGKTIEREMSTHIEPPPPKRISKFKASRQ
jgi:hypothetical protein